MNIALTLSISIDNIIIFLFLKTKYKRHVHVSNEIINAIFCSNSYTITHLFRSTPQQRLKCMQASPAYPKIPAPL